MLDAVVEVTNGSGHDVSLEAVYSGLMMYNHQAEPAVIVMEANQDMLYSGVIQSGATVVTHLTFELAEQREENRVYLYFDGKYHEISWEK